MFKLLPVAFAIALVMTGLPFTSRPVVAQQTAPNPSQQSTAEKFVQDFGTQAITVVSDKGLSADQRRDKYRGILNEAFDMQTIGKFVLGRAWNTATPQQQQDYMKIFDALVIKIYGDRLNFYNGDTFHVKGSRPESANEMVVNSEIDHPQGATPTPVDWRVRQNNGKFAVIDVTIEGVSQSLTQRQEYASVLQRNNGNVDALIAMMRQNLQQGADAPVTQ